MTRKNVSRRDFLKKSTMGGAALAGVGAIAGALTPAAEPESSADRYSIVAALGDALVPSTPDPGYKSLEVYNITAEVLKGLTILSDVELRNFNEGSHPHFGGKPFVQLNEGEREQYLNLIIEGSQINDARLLQTLRKVYRLTRNRVFTVYYSNYPEHVIPRDENDVPILPPGDQHQITNPNTNRITTGWDIAGYEPQLSWEHEEERRAMAKRMGMWEDE
ncbi:MAG: gluconate 2-dehydrogenase subunit 3 family protein [Acidobacteria bacterium]|nr:gluconate 2-dehydrogenase subunit 3 family protein [Acidobacteriota bacterium]